MKGGQEVVCNSAGQFRDAVSGRGSDEEQVYRLRNQDVIERPIEIASCVLPLEHVDIDFVSRQSSKRERRHKLGGASGHQDKHFIATVLQPSQEIRGLVAS